MIQAHDACNQRVHPAISDPRAGRAASIASATTACWLRRPAPTTSRAPASCSQSLSPKPSPPTPPIITTRSPAHTAAADDHHRDLARGSMPRHRPQGPMLAIKDRHVMTRPRACKSACSLRWLSAGCPSARSNIQLSTQIEHEPSPFDACNLLARQPHRHRSVRWIFSPSLCGVICGNQIPIACDEPSAIPSQRFPPLEVFRRRPRTMSRARHRAGIRKPSQTRTSAYVCGTSASPPKADMPGSPSDVAEGPKAAVPENDRWRSQPSCQLVKFP